jgi:hypothetical protein
LTKPVNRPVVHEPPDRELDGSSGQNVARSRQQFGPRRSVQSSPRALRRKRAGNMTHTSTGYGVGMPNSRRGVRDVPILDEGLYQDLDAYLAAHSRRSDPDAGLWPGKVPPDVGVTPIACATFSGRVGLYA